jgi:short-subunit dehydrogenase
VRPLVFKERWVLVTGASSGLGAALAKEFAGRGANLLLVARRQQQLEELAAEVERLHHVKADVLALDLSSADAAARLFSLATAERQIYAFVSNAAAYHFGELSSLDESTAEAMMQLNALTPIRLLRRFLPYLDARGAGGALVVTSTGAVMPTPFQATYGASKAMLHSFVQSLQYERGGEAAALPLCLCCPGGMPTELLTSSPVNERLKEQFWIQRMMLEPAVVAREAVDALAARRLLHIPGKLNRVMVTLSRLLPTHTLGKGARRVYAGE